MDRLWTAALGVLVPSAGDNLLQDLADATRIAKGSALTTQSPGLEGRLFQATADLTTWNLVVVDEPAAQIVDPATNTVSLGAFDWNDRMVLGFFRAMASATEYPGGANDYAFDSAGAPTLFWGYLGNGALNGVGGQVSPGNPPVPAVGTSWACLISANIWLYLDAADGKLKLYNNTGSTLRSPAMFLFATGPTGARP